MLEQFVYLRDQYTPEAIAIFEKEISVRGISKEQIKEFVEQTQAGEHTDSNAVSVKHLRKEDFSCLDGFFITTHSHLLTAMLADGKIPHYLDAASDLGPHKPADTKKYMRLFIHKDSLEAASKLIDTHFDRIDNVYSIKYSDVVDRLNAFSFQDIVHGDIDDAVIEGIDLSKTEKDVLIRYAGKLLNEIDAVETQQQRIVFFFDNCEDLIEKLESEGSALTKNDLLTALEVLQIYCKDEGFGDVAATIAEELLEFFTQ